MFVYVCNREGGRKRKREEERRGRKRARVTEREGRRKERGGE